MDNTFSVVLSYKNWYSHVTFREGQAEPIYEPSSEAQVYHEYKMTISSFHYKRKN